MRTTRCAQAAMATLSAFALTGNALAQTTHKAADVHPPGYSRVVAGESLGK